MPRGRPRKSAPEVLPPFPKKEEVKKMNVADREALKQQMAQAEAQLKPTPTDAAGNFYQPPSQDPGALRESINRKKLLLQRDDDLVARGGEKDRLYNRQKEIEGILKNHKPTQREMSQMPTGNNSSAFARAVEHNVKYQEKYQGLEHELQDIKVRLEPDDPNAHSTEYLRSDVSDGAVTI